MTWFVPNVISLTDNIRRSQHGKRLTNGVVKLQHPLDIIKKIQYNTTVIYSHYDFVRQTLYDLKLTIS